MKKSKDIIAHLINQPSFKKIVTQECIQNVMKILPPGVLIRIRFGYIKNQTLFFVLNHPGAKFEFDNIIKSIKKLLIECINYCDTQAKVTDVKAFVTNKPQIQESSQESSHIPTFQERAHATFANPFADPKMYALLEEIKAIIEKNHAS